MTQETLRSNSPATLRRAVSIDGVVTNDIVTDFFSSAMRSSYKQIETHEYY